MGAFRRINALCVVAFALFAATAAQQCSSKLNGYLVLAEEGSIVKVDTSGENREVLTSSVNQAISLDFDYHRNILYWADLESAEIYALDEGASKPRLVVPKQKQWLPFSLTVDSVTEKLYVGDGFSGTVRIFDLKNDKLEGIVVGNDLREVRSIGIDVNAGYLFVNDRYQILRTNLDGSNRKVLYEYESEDENEIVPPQYIREPISVFRILVDPETKRLYWIDSLARNIVSSDYSGQDRKIVFQARDEQPIAESLGSLAILDNYLYWSDLENNVVYKIDLESSSSSRILSTAPFFIKAISCPSQKSISNPCAQNNGDCEQLCVLSKDSKGSHKCACQVGYEIAEDQRSCVKVRNFLLFTQDNFIRGQSFNTDAESHDDVINPSQFPVGSGTLVDYNAEAGVVYHNGNFPQNHLYQVNLDSGEQSKLEPNLLSKDVRWLAYDWASKNLYYFTYYYADQFTLSVLNVEDPTYSKIIVNDVQRLVAGLAVHPHKGYVYFGQNINDEYARIVRVNSDGSDLKVVVDLGKSITVASLAIDLEENRLYWSQSERSGDDNLSTLRNSNLDGGDVISVNLPANLNFAELAIHKELIYGINRTQTQLLRLNKRNLSNKAVLVRDSPPGTLSGLKIFSKEVQNVKPDHPCAAGKHQCEKFCFAVEGKAFCGCPYGEKLDVDGKTCIDNSKAEPPFKPCNTTLVGACRYMMLSTRETRQIDCPEYQ